MIDFGTPFGSEERAGLGEDGATVEGTGPRSKSKFRAAATSES